MTRDPLVIVATLSLAGLAFFLLVEHVPKWLRALAWSKPFDGIRKALAPIALPGWIKTLGMLAWSAMLLTLLAGMFFVILTGLAKLPGITPETAPDLRWYLLTLTAITAALGAVIALPFTLRRTVQNERQTRTAEEGYITQQINEAVANLAAEKEVSRVWRTVAFDLGERKVRDIESTSERYALPEFITESDVTYGAWQLGHRTKPNIEVRVGAILALERLARQRAETALREKDTQNRGNRTPDGILNHDGARDHVRIMEVFCAYIRENAPKASAIELFLGEWPKIPDDANETRLRTRSIGLNDRGNALHAWTQSLEKPRTDIQLALRVLGRRTVAQRSCEGDLVFREKNFTDEIWHNGDHWFGYRLDLRRTNLQSSELSHSVERPMDLSHADLSESNLQGAALNNAHLEGAKLKGAALQGANLADGKLASADLLRANLERAEMVRADLRRSRLNVVQAQNAGFNGAQLQHASFFCAELESSRFAGAEMQASNLRGSGLENAFLTDSDLTGAQLGSGRSSSLGASRDDSRVTGARLRGATMRNARLDSTETDGTTELSASSMGGASLRSVKLWADLTEPKLLTNSFGDRSVTFEGQWPAGFTKPDTDGTQRADTTGKLAHWSPKLLDDDEFEAEWRSFQAKLDKQPEDPG